MKSMVRSSQASELIFAEAILRRSILPLQRRSKLEGSSHRNVSKDTNRKKGDREPYV